MVRSEGVQRPDVRDGTEHETAAYQPGTESEILQIIGDWLMPNHATQVTESRRVISAVGVLRTSLTDSYHHTNERQHSSKNVEHDEEQTDVHASNVVTTGDTRAGGVALNPHKAPTGDLRGVNTFFSEGQMISPSGHSSLLVVRK